MLSVLRLHNQNMEEKHKDSYKVSVEKDENRHESWNRRRNEFSNFEIKALSFSKKSSA